MTMINSRAISCWTCKHFQPLLDERVAPPIPADGSGECRALPPAACCSVESPSAEPIYPEIVDSEITWCSAWMQTRDPLGDYPGVGQ